jgi:ketosteroid isomerase-like protein
MSQENVETVRKIYTDFNSADPRAFDNFDPAIEFRQTAGLLGTAGTYRGHEGLRIALGELLATFKNIRIETSDVLYDEGEEVVVRVRIRGDGRRSGIPIDTHLFHVWSLRDRKAVRWDVLDTEEDALEAAGLRE